MKILKYWIPLAVAITFLCGLVTLVEQQNLRQSADDPQIQIAEDIATRLNGGESPTVFAFTNKTKMHKSLAPFVIIVNEEGEIFSSSVELDGEIPVPPREVLDYAKEKNKNHFTWEPELDVRNATVVISYKNQDSSGYVTAGRSLREI